MAILLAFAMMTGAVGCGSGDAAPEEPVQEEQSEEDSDITEAEGNTDYLEYTPGTYYQSYSEEMNGEMVEVTYSIELFDDQTGIMHIQDDIDITWDKTHLITEDATYFYTIEGESLYVQFDEDADWACFEKGENYRDIVDSEFSKYAGTYTSKKGHTLVIDEKGNVIVTIVGISENMEGSASGVEKGVMPMVVTDERGNPMHLEFAVDSKTLTITETTYPILRNGDQVTLDN